MRVKIRYLWIKISTRLWLGASKQGYSVIMFLSPGPCAFDQFLSILWRQEMIPHSTYRQIHGDSSRTSGTLVLWKKQKQTTTKYNSAFIPVTVFLSSLHSIKGKSEGEEAREMNKGLSPNQFIILSNHHDDCPTHLLHTRELIIWLFKNNH